ncbi:MAG: velvet protein [Piccolia ochrophora]|nr:MAG: velvet protein [Piccolia ochrophora]
MATVIPVRNETKSTMARMTKDGRKLTYQLNVIQQPERARACGSGAKSSADRRPVDPPPVVELRIYEGEAMNEITFSYNANFFLFTTLEPARPIAQGRVPQTPAAFPVLTGMPVSGMAYLDRPTPAGYFLFPDLSVRHEGKYRLSFNLYEEVKDPKDADAEPATNHPDHPDSTVKLPGSYAPKAHVDWRLEVRSKPFTVFSAKKFPGLAESTALSRIVAEQGCRVRIRRDVRMRRRDTKAAPEFEDYEDDAGYVRARATPTPDPYQQSAAAQSSHKGIETQQAQPSSGSANDTVPYHIEPQRRASVSEQTSYGQPQYQQMCPPAPVVMSTQPNAYGQMSYGGAPTAQYQAPQYAQPGQAMVPPPPVYSHPQTSYFQSLSNHYQQPQALQSQHVPRDSAESVTASRRGSVAYNTPYQSHAAPNHGYGYVDNYARPQSTFQYMNPPPTVSGARTPTPTMNGHALPPLKMPKPFEPKYDSANSSAGVASAHAAPPLHSPSYDTSHHRTSSFQQYSAPPSSASEPTRSAKRPYSAVFDTSQYDQAYRHGMRPSESQVGVEARQPDVDEDDFDNAWELEQMKMHYKRADGTEISRRLPAVG